MAGLLGFDPSLVAALDAAMRRALADLDCVRCTDVDATAAMRRIAQCRSLLAERWLPFTAGVLGCRAMDGYRPVVVEAGDLTAVWAAAVTGREGWRLLTDPLGPSPADLVGAGPLTARDAIALATVLSGAAGAAPFGAPLDPGEVAWLAGVLGRIAADPSLVAAFLPAFTTNGWTALCDRLARDRQLRMTAALLDDARVSQDEIEWDAIDTAFAALGAMVVDDHERHPLSRPVLLLDEMTPFAAAMLAQHLVLGAGELAALTRELVTRERILIDTTAETLLGPRAADLLLATILRTPGAAATYVLTVRDDPGLLLGVSDDPALGRRVAIMGTDPTEMSAADAEQAVPDLVRWYLDAAQRSTEVVRNPALASDAADLVAPYLLPLLRSTSAWEMPRRQRRALEDLLLGDDAAFDHLLAQRDRVVAGLGTPLPTDTAARVAAVRDIADLLALIDTMGQARVLRSAEAARAEWDLLWTVIGYGQNLLRLGGAASTVASGAVSVLRRALEAGGWAWGDVPAARRNARADYDRLTTVAAASLVATTFDEMVAAGRIPHDAALPPTPDPSAGDTGSRYSAAFSAWLTAGGFDDDVVFELAAIKQAIASDHETTADENAQLLDG